MSEAPKWKNILDMALGHYSSEKYYKALLEAKDLYFKKTGVAHEEDEDYESRMNSFNNWYLFEFRYPTWHQNAIQMFIKEDLKENLRDESLIKGFEGQIHSVFEYKGKGLFGKEIIVDLLHKKKLTLSKENITPSLVKNDLFIGRVIPFEETYYLMDGLSILPVEARSNIVKECKKVRKYDSLREESKFLLQLEALRTKWKRYGHLDANRIFVF